MYIPVYPYNILDPDKYLVREETVDPDELIYNARTLNLLLIEVARLQLVLGTFPSWSSGVSIGRDRVFGDGSDGDVTISGGTTTLTQDMYYNNLTIASDGDLSTDGFRVFVKETLTLAGSIYCDWNAAGTLGVGAAAETNATNAMGGDGGSGGGASAGTPGTVTAPALAATSLDIKYATTLFNPTGLINGGAGGSDGTDGGGTGGTGGQGGAVLMVAARNIKSDGITTGAAATAYGTPGPDGTISAPGEGGTDGSGGGDGGGGGGGGAVFVVYSTLTDLAGDSFPSGYVVAVAAGGPAGTPAGSPVAEQGSAGMTLMIQA